MMSLYRNPYVHVLEVRDGFRAFNSLTLELFELSPHEASLLRSDPAVLGISSVRDLVEAGLLCTAPVREHEGSSQRTRDRRAVAERREGVFTSMRLSLTEKCNLACDYCFQQKMFDDVQPEMDEELLDQTIGWFVDQAAGMALTVQYFGGEPLMKWDLLQRADRFLRSAQDAGTIPAFRQTITTNGTLLTRSRAEWLVQRGFDVTVSLDGPPEVNDRSRVNKAGRGTYRTAVRGLQNYATAGGDCAILMTATAENVTLLPQYVRYFIEDTDLPIRTVGLNSPQPTSTGWETGGETLARSVHAVWRYCESRGVGFHGPGTFIPEHLATRTPQTDGCIDLTRHESLTAGWPVYVSADGKKSLCLVHHNDERTSPGSIALGMPSVRGVPSPSSRPSRATRPDLDTDAATASRAKRWHHEAPVSERCDSCIALSFCGGPCSVERLLWDGALSSDRCDFMQTMSSLVLTDA
jgi:uncharacterized protein